MLKVLIADDESWMRRSVFNSIDWTSMELSIVGEAEDGLQALEIIDATNPDIVLTDIKMPEIDGIELLRRSMITHPNTAFIFFSGYDSFQYAQSALNLGAVAYILKPFEREQLQEAVEKAKARILHENSLKNHAKTVTEKSLFFLPEDENADFYESLAENLKKYIRENFSGDVSLEVMAREFHFSPNYISRIFKTETGQSLHEYLLSYRIEAAKTLLKDVRNSIGDVATLTGYKNNPKYFSKIFKKVTGITPQEYIRKK